MSSRSGSGVCGCFTVIIGFGVFSIVWDVAAEAWGLGHGQVLLIFLGAAFVVSMLVQWWVESGWSVQGWWNRKRRARRARER